MRGIPDKSAVPSAFLNYQSTFTLGPAQGAVGTWSFDATLMPHPVNFLYLSETDSQGTVRSNFMNTQLTGSNHRDKLNSFIAGVRRWRLAYMSVTVYQDGPDLANQGTLVAAQVPFVPLNLNTVGQYNATGFPGMVADYPALPVEYWETSDMPNFTTLQSMPSAYFGRSREGAYIPLKLTKTCQQWRGMGDLRLQAPSPIDVTNPMFRGFVELPWIGAMPTQSQFPHTNLEAVMTNHEPAFAPNGFFGWPTSPMCNEVAAHFCARNLAVTTSFSFFVRAGFEVQVQPGSIYTTHLKLSPPHDPLALSTYFAIARELKDAYPADHNDLGKIWDVISSVAKTVAPALAAVPGFGAPLSMAVSAAATAGDAIKSALSRGKRAMVPRPANRDMPSVADAELARGIIAAKRARLPRPAPIPPVVGRQPRGRQRKRRQKRRRSKSSN